MTDKSPLRQPRRAIGHLSIRVYPVELAWLSAHPCSGFALSDRDNPSAAVESVAEEQSHGQAGAGTSGSPAESVDGFRLALLDLIPASCHTRCTHCQADKEDGMSIHPLRTPIVSDEWQAAQMTLGYTVFARSIDMPIVMR